MNILPGALEDLIESFAVLPGVGQKTAERYAYYLVKQPDNTSAKLASVLNNLKSQIKQCPKTFALISSSQSESDLYSNPKRDKTTIAVVAEPFDIVAIEKTAKYQGTYHVLGGLISPLDGISPDSLHIPELLSRIIEDRVVEVILATSASVEGESTALYIQSRINEQNPNIKVTRLARGLPIGLDIEYADQITLSRALENRQSF